MLDEKGRRVRLLLLLQRHVDRAQRYSVAADADCAPGATCAQKRSPTAGHVTAASDFVDVESASVGNRKCWNTHGVRPSQLVCRGNIHDRLTLGPISRRSSNPYSPHGDTHAEAGGGGGATQPAAAATAAEAAADRRAASNSNGFEAGADSGRRHSRVPATELHFAEESRICDLFYGSDQSQVGFEPFLCSHYVFVT